MAATRYADPGHQKFRFSSFTSASIPTSYYCGLDLHVWPDANSSTVVMPDVCWFPEGSTTPIASKFLLFSICTTLTLRMAVKTQRKNMKSSIPIFRMTWPYDCVFFYCQLKALRKLLANYTYRLSLKVRNQEADVYWQSILMRLVILVQFKWLELSHGYFFCKISAKYGRYIGLFPSNSR